jgi:hypothetical protein
MPQKLPIAAATAAATGVTRTGIALMTGFLVFLTFIVRPSNFPRLPGLPRPGWHGSDL